uniref:Uncharacterized protein n=1 Tax=Aegilops tauschii subsp. strangulata TaxID=200361 RepID=A0A453QVN9_AEGTS
QFLKQSHVQGTQRLSCHWVGDLCWYWPSISLLLCVRNQRTGLLSIQRSPCRRRLLSEDRM